MSITEVQPYPTHVGAGDVFRKSYQVLHPTRAELVESIKDKAAHLYGLFEYANNREMSIAKTKLEEAVMWAVKSISADPEKSIGEIQD